MKTLIIKANDQDQRLDKFLQKAVPKLPKSLLYKYLRLKRIKVNSKKSEISYRLKTDDIVELYVNDEFFNDSNSGDKEFMRAPANIDIVYEDDNILLVNKKVGLCVHEDNDNEVDTLINRCLHYLYENGEYRPDDELSFIPALCNRIDRNTSGIVIVAKNAEALRVMNEKIKNRELQKYYLCVVSGLVDPPKATLTHYLQRNENDSTVRVFDRPTPETKTIITSYEVLKQSRKNSLLEVELKTGRTHQIRAHMAYIHHPIIGDGKYGLNRVNREYNEKTQLLCAYKLKFTFADENHALGYLNGMEFSVEDIWFVREFDEKF